MDVTRNQQLNRAARGLLASALAATALALACSSPSEPAAADASAGSGGTGAAGAGGADGSSGGVSGGATGGAAGYAFGHCPTTTPSICSVEDTCSVLQCGEPWSPLDAQGCMRPPCLADEDCAAEDRCVLPHMWAPGCYPSEWSCGLTFPGREGTCFCDAQTADCQRGPVCVPTAVAPPAEDCTFPLESAPCSMLVETVSALFSILGSVSGAAHDAMQACYDKLKPALKTLGCE